MRFVKEPEDCFPGQFVWTNSTDRPHFRPGNEALTSRKVEFFVLNVGYEVMHVCL